MKKQDELTLEKEGGELLFTVEPLWTVEEVSKYLRLEPNTIRMMARENIIPGKKVSKRWRFVPQDIIDWIDMK